MNKWVLLFLLYYDVYDIAVILQHFLHTSAVKDLLSCCRLKEEGSLTRTVPTAKVSPSRLLFTLEGGSQVVQELTTAGP